MSATPRLSLPFLSAGQAQKEFTHNEALQTLDFIAAAAVEEDPRADPPASPTIGSCYIVGPSPTGAWAGKSQFVAGYSAGGWRFIAPIEGMSAYVRTSGTLANYRSGAWEIGILRGSSVVIGGEQVVGGRNAPISSPAGGTVIDSEARTAIDGILSALRDHGLIAI
jgi:hypothetical protein